MRYQPVGPYEVFSWSIAGNETCVAVRDGEMRFAFDMGFAPNPVISCDYVFISHGHTDHIGAIAQHMKKRHLNRLSKAVYYMPPWLVEHVRAVCKAHAAMAELEFDGAEFDCPLVPIAPGSRMPLLENWVVEAIETHHSVKSQGYILSKRDRDGQEYPEIAYLGDSRFSVLKEAPETCPALLSVHLLIMEATFLDRPERMLERAISHGHTHLNELKQNISLLKSIDYIYLIHFSARYNADQICHLTRAGMPRWFADRIIPSLCAQRCLTMD